MSEMEYLRSFLRSAPATETATTTITVLPIQSMLVKIQCQQSTKFQHSVVVSLAVLHDLLKDSHSCGAPDSG